MKRSIEEVFSQVFEPAEQNISLTSDFLDECRYLVGQVRDEFVFRTIISLCTLKVRRFLVRKGSNEIFDKHGKIIRYPQVRDPEEILTVVKAIEHFRFICNKTYENSKMSAALAIVDEENLSDFQASIRVFITEFSNLPTIFEISRDELFKITQLSDGKHTVILSNFQGKLLGLAPYSGQSKYSYGMELDLGDITLRSDRHGFVHLSTPYNSRLFFDGFEWFIDDSEIALKELANKVKMDTGIFNLNWIEFQKLVDNLSEFRLSSIIAIASKNAISDLKSNGILISMRPHLDFKYWSGHFFSDTHLPIFRLDGAHILDNDFDVHYLCQRVFVDQEANTHSGSGATAAQFLSKALGTDGFVLKVSSDGPKKLFFDGEMYKSTTSFLRERN